MSTHGATEPDPPEERRDKPLVSFIRLRCNSCRRARGAYLARVGKRGADPHAPDFVPVCPHHATVWAPGRGPEAARNRPPRDTPPKPWDTSPPV